jgi:AcrR family transcriptional regulator
MRWSPTSTSRHHDDEMVERLTGSWHPSFKVTEVSVRVAGVVSSASESSPPVARDSEASGESVRGARWVLVENQILTEATELFAKRGFAGTTLKDIADAMGMSRPALYHYFANKEALLARLVSDLTLGPAEALAKVRRRRGKSSVERLHTMTFDTALRHARQPDRFRVLVFSDAELPSDLSKAYRDGRRRILAEFVAVIEEGVASHVLRPVDPRIAALGIIGQCTWVAFWYHPGYDADERDVATTLADMAVASLTLADARATDARGPKGAIELLKQDLALLEASLASDRSGPRSRR